MNRRYYILTFGCQMNKNDSERIVGFLNSLGMQAVGVPEDADFLLINTCSVRQASEDRVVGTIKNWQELRKNRPNLVVAVTGCMPGRDKDRVLRKKMKGIDLWFGIDELLMLPKWLGELGQVAENDYLELSPARSPAHQAFVTIQTGCNNFCAYCVVPYSRGRERNRRVVDILEEIKTAVAGGSKEILLLGQVVNHYIAPDPENFSKDNPFVALSSSCPVVIPDRDPGSSGDTNVWIPVFTGMTGVRDDFAALLWEINQVAGDFRIHWTAADPQYFSDAQIEALKLPKQVNYLHLPAQSGDNEILKKMNRHYTREKYLDLIKKIRTARPEIAIGTDLVLGFCGETEEQFANTVDLFKQCDFDIAYQAMYSPRSGTVAAKVFQDDVPKVEKKRRWQVVQDLMEEMVYQKNQKYLHQVVEALVDRCEQGICSGNSDEMKLAQFPGTVDLVGQLVKIKITQAKTWVIRGVCIL